MKCLQTLALGVIFLLLLADGIGGHKPKPFPLSDVFLAEGTDHRIGFDLNLMYILDMLEPDRLLAAFRQTAKFATKVEPYGGWEASNIEIRGQFIGHYLSATAMAYNYTSGASSFDNQSAKRAQQLRVRCDLMVKELIRIQDAFGNGYLSAFPSSHFDRLEALEPVWAPYYVIHKLLAGLIDQHILAATSGSLKAAEKLADYFCQRSKHSIQINGTHHWYDQVLETEFGGMQESLHALADLTGKMRFHTCALFFSKPSFYQPLVKGKDTLPGRHANTHLAQVNGFAANYHYTGDPLSRTAVENFMQVIHAHHTFPTGGSNWHEAWHEADTLGDVAKYHEHGADSQESCTQYNILKIARYLFTWTGHAGFADFYERALLNGVIGIQRRPHHHTHDRAASIRRRLMLHDQSESTAIRLYPHNELPAPGPGQYIYMQPLGPPPIGKPTGNHGWGTPFDSMWCCYGTAIESFSKIADSVYFHDGPNVFINQLVSSTLQWHHMGIVLAMKADVYPIESTVARATLTIEKIRNGSRKFTIHWRVPTWAKDIKVKVQSQGQHQTTCTMVEGGRALAQYCQIAASWESGDVIDIEMGMKIYAERVIDKRPEMKNLMAIMMGPYVMVGLADTADRELDVDPERVDESVSALPSGMVPLYPKGSRLVQGKSKKFVIAPIGQVIDENYTAFFEFIGARALGG